MPSQSGIGINALTAATGANSINNGDNAQTWNWSLTTASRSAFSFAENVASTASGTPILLNINTLASSTAYPFQVTAAGTANGIRVDKTTGTLSAIGTANVNATQLNGNSTIGTNQGGTGQTTVSAAFDALAPTTTQGDLIYRGASSNGRLALGSNGQCLTSNGSNPIWATCGTTVSINSTNVSNPNFNGTTPAAPANNQNVIWQSSSSSVSAYVPLATLTQVGLVQLAGDLANNSVSPQVVSTHLTAPLPTAQGGTAQNSTATFPTSGTVAVGQTCTNQALTAVNGTGTAGNCKTLTSAYVDPSIAQTGVDINTSFQVTVTHLALPLPGAQGGTANAFFVVSGPASSLKTFTFPNASATVLTSNAPVTIAQGGSGQITAAAAFNALSPITSIGDLIIGNGANSATRLAIGPIGTCFTSNGTTALWGFCSPGGITGSGSPAPTQVAVFSGSQVITGYNGFTSDSNGNVTANSFSTGTGFTAGTIAAAGDLLCFTGNSTVGDCGTSATNFVGTADATTGSIQPHVLGLVTLNYDATVSPSAGWYACSSAITGGTVTAQATACLLDRQVGIVAVGGTNQTAGSVWLAIR